MSFEHGTSSPAPEESFSLPDHRESFFEQEGDHELIPPGFLSFLRKGVRALESREQLLAMDPIDRIESATAAIQIVQRGEWLKPTKEYYDPMMEHMIVSEAYSEEQARNVFLENIYYPYQQGFLHSDLVKYKMKVTDLEGADLLREAFISAYASYCQELRYGKQVVDHFGITTDQQAQEVVVFLDATIKTAREELKAKEPPPEIRAFDPLIQEIIVPNIVAIELNKGCSVGCPFCAFAAENKVTASVPFRDAVWLRSESMRLNIRPQGEQVHNPLFYLRSDPLDYRDTSEGQERTYADLMRVFADELPFTSTAYPRKAKTVLREIPWAISRISVGSANVKRFVKEGLFVVTEQNGVIPKDRDLQRALLFPPRSSAIANCLIPSFVHYAGRKRTQEKAVSEQEGEIGGSIACMEGVVYSSGKMRNTIRMYSSEHYSEGVAEAELHTEQVQNGEEQVQKLKKRLEQEESIPVEELLRYGIVRAHNARGIFPIQAWALRESGKMHPKVKKESIREQEYEFIFYTFETTSLPEEKKDVTSHRHNITYNAVSGEVVSIR